LALYGGKTALFVVATGAIAGGAGGKGLRTGTNVNANYNFVAVLKR